MKRVAVCFYGQVRMLETFHIYWEHFRHLKDYQFDFFISTWNDFKKESLNFKFEKSRFIDPHINNKWNSSLKFLKPVFLLREVCLLKQEYEIHNGVHYDAVLITRPDIIFDRKVLLEEIAELKEHNPGRPCIQFFQKKFYNVDNCWKIELEGGFLTTSEVSDLFTGLYSFLTTEKYKKSPYRYNKDAKVLNFGYLLFANYFNLLILPSRLIGRLLRPNRDIPLLKKYFLNKFEWKQFDIEFHNNFHPVLPGHTKQHPTIRL